MTVNLLRPHAAHAALFMATACLLACGGARAHQGGLGNEVMWDACVARKVDDPCSFQSADHEVFRGSCQAMAGTRVCVRNQPIEPATNALHTHRTAEVAANAGDVGRGWAWVGAAFVLFVGGLTACKISRSNARSL